MKYIATIKFTEQVTEDQWTRTHKHLEVTPETPVGKIFDWMKTYDRGKIQSVVIRQVDELV